MFIFQSDESQQLKILTNIQGFDLLFLGTLL